MWLPNRIIAEVNEVARVHYVDAATCKLWNEHRRAGELRLLTGWTWTARVGNAERQGFKTRTIAIRDAWYALVAKQRTPALTRARLRVVSERRAG